MQCVVCRVFVLSPIVAVFGESVGLSYATVQCALPAYISALFPHFSSHPLCYLT